MRAVVTRVLSASVTIDGKKISERDKGFLVLLGVHKDDTKENAVKIADKICGLRVFEDENGKMNINPKDAGAKLLIVSQFTLYADCSSRRPGFTDAAR
ncbi:MAG: D-tyrosyl-tRNA(Tyr) deacylase, partial [Lachnospiraceae bacterium]|nr:D-tyrosyl-tRNA(Tyr) deacylase [Lachnospiraceae bacterium]